MFQGPATSAPNPTPDGALAESVRATYRGLLAAGLTETEAGNLSAHLAGLAHVRHGWQMREIERLLFIRALVEQHRIEP
jgi:hypothetical protein